MDNASIADAKGDPARMQLARDLLQAVGDKASNLITHTKSSSYIAKFGIETIETLGTPLKSFTVQQWEAYGEPLLASFDDTLDRAITAVKSPFAGSTEEEGSASEQKRIVQCDQTAYNLYWERVKELFMKSRWFAQVDKILKENGFLELMKHSVLRPAEMFFNTAAEVFRVEKSLNGFLVVLRKRVGRVWDGRLAALAASFYRAAEMVAGSIGAKKCLQGLLNLGRARKDMAMNDLISHFEEAKVVGPESETNVKTETSTLPSVKSRRMQRNMADFPTSSQSTLPQPSALAGVQSSHTLSPPHPQDLCSELKYRPEDLNPCVSPRKRIRKASEKMKSSRRFRQPYPYSRHTAVRVFKPQILRQKLREKKWFTEVDCILGQNDFIKALSSQIVPSNHFFQTALRIMKGGRDLNSSQKFCRFMSAELGFAWDSRLAPLAADFYHVARTLLTHRRRPKISTCDGWKR
ncbi:hypothetical protein AAMO2058_000369500 [Amorphochlora amoebiformis]